MPIIPIQTPVYADPIRPWSATEAARAPNLKPVQREDEGLVWSVRDRGEDEDGSRTLRNKDGDSATLSREGLEKSKEGLGKSLNTGMKDLDEVDQHVVRRMQQRDAEVRQHEQAHVSASGRLSISGPIYQMEQGPDGRMYVTGGKVNFRMPPTQNPREKLELAEQLRRMALAPASPSAKDRSVAAQAALKMSEARMELAEEKQQELEGEEVPAMGRTAPEALGGQLYKRPLLAMGRR